MQPQHRAKLHIQTHTHIERTHRSCDRHHNKHCLHKPNTPTWRSSVCLSVSYGSCFIEVLWWNLKTDPNSNHMKAPVFDLCKLSESQRGSQCVCVVTHSLYTCDSLMDTHIYKDTLASKVPWAKYNYLSRNISLWLVILKERSYVLFCKFKQSFCRHNICNSGL